MTISIGPRIAKQTNYTGSLIGTAGAVYWYDNGLIHRDGGPAIEYPNGNKSWYQFGDLHRADGPAVDWQEQQEWWYMGRFCGLTREEFEDAIMVSIFWD